MPDITFGPVPSRRLGQSLGINNIPPKTCSYSCTYCQLGVTRSFRVKRGAFYDAAGIVERVRRRVEMATAGGERIDYLTVVPDGEPTLDQYLGWELWQLSGLGLRTAVITNGSLLWRSDVREDLLAADLVSVKVDAVRRDVWRAINVPHKTLRLDEVLHGIRTFAEEYGGRLITETMLVDGVNDQLDNLEPTAQFVASIAPDCAYLSVPTRPPAKAGVRPASPQSLTTAYGLFKAQMDAVEYLVGYEGNAFASSGEPQADLLSITAVHPMKEEAVEKLLSRSNAEWTVVEELLAKGVLAATEYRGEKFYARVFRASDGNGSRSALSTPSCPWLE